MILGKIKPNENKVKFKADIICTSCQKKVPGGLVASESYYGTESFMTELEEFKKNYLCGRCRDKKRVKKH